MRHLSDTKLPGPIFWHLAFQPLLLASNQKKQTNSKSSKPILRSLTIVCLIRGAHRHSKTKGVNYELFVLILPWHCHWHRIWPIFSHFQSHNLFFAPVTVVFVLYTPNLIWQDYRFQLCFRNMALFDLLRICDVSKTECNSFCKKMHDPRIPGQIHGVE